MKLSKLALDNVTLGFGMLFLASSSVVTSQVIFGFALSAWFTGTILVILVSSFFLLCLQDRSSLRATLDGPFLLLSLFVLYIWVSASQTRTIPGLQVAAITSCLLFVLIVFSRSGTLDRLKVHRFLLTASVFGLVLFITSALGVVPINLDPRSFAMTAVLGLALSLGKTRSNLKWWLLVLMFLFAIAWSGSRAATLAAVAGISLFTFLATPGKVRRILYAGGSFTVGAVLALVVFFFNPANRLRVLDPAGVEIEIMLGEATVGISTSGRLGAWSAFLALAVRPRDWIFGLGAGATSRYGRENLDYFPQVLNEYLRVLLDFGLVGLVLFLGWLVWTASELHRRGTTAETLSAAVAIATSSILAITDGPFIYPFSAIPFALIVGSALAEKPSSQRR